MLNQKLLVVVDMQNDFVTGTLGFEKAKSVVPEVVKKIEEAVLDPAFKIVVTQDTHQEHYLQTREGGALPVVHCVKGSEGWQLDEAVQAALSDVSYITLEKPSFGLHAEAIMSLKKEIGNAVTEIHVCGLVSNICVISNAVVLQANFPEATVYVDAKATASFDDSLNDAALMVLEGLQVKVSKGCA